MTARGIIVLLVVVAAAGSSTARAQYADVGLWFGTGLKQEVSKAWNWTVEWENRWNMGLSHHDRMLVDLGLERRLNKHWDVSAQWRWSEEDEVLGYLPSSRIALRFTGGWKLGHGQMKTRLMATQDVMNSSNSEDIGNANFGPTLRFRTGYDFQLNQRWEVGMSCELLKSPPLMIRNDLRSRLQMGVSRNMSDSWTLSAIYLLGNEWFEADPWTDHILRIQSNWNLADWNEWRSRQRLPKARTYPQQPAARLSLNPSEISVCSSEHLRWSEVDAKGDPADFIELKNTSNQRCSLEGWRLTDSLEQLGLIFGPVFIPAEGYWVGFEGGQESFDFGISSEGESLFLISPTGEELPLTTINQPDNRSQHLDLSGVLKLLAPTPGAPPPPDRGN